MFANFGGLLARPARVQSSVPQMAVGAEISIGSGDRNPGRRRPTAQIGWAERPARPGNRVCKELVVAKAYYSTVFERPAADVWKIVRDFNNYPVWVRGAGESRLRAENRAHGWRRIRNVLYQGRRIRSGYVAQSDVERSQTYEFCDPPTAARLSRHTAGYAGRRWRPRFCRMVGDFDCEPLQRAELTETLRILVRKLARSHCEIDRGRCGEVAGACRVSGRVAPISANFAKMTAISGC